MRRSSSTSGQLPEASDIHTGSIYHGSEINRHHSLSNRSPPAGTRLSNSGETLIASGNDNTHGIDGFIPWSSSNHGSGIANDRGVDAFIGWRHSHPRSTWNLEDQANDDEAKDQGGGSVCSNFRGVRAEPCSFIPSIIRSSNQLTPRLASFQNSMNSTNSRPADAIRINSVEHGNSRPSIELLLTSSGNHNQANRMYGGSSSSTGERGFSCKRRSFEGTSPQSLSISSSLGSNLQAENPDWLDSHGPTIYSRRMRLLSPSSWHTLVNSPLDQQSPRGETATREIDFEPFPSTSAPGNGEHAQRLFSRHVDLESIPQQEPVHFNRSSGRTSRGPFALHQPYRPGSSGEGIDLRSALRLGSMSSLPAVANVSNGTEVSCDMPAFPWNGASQSSSGNSSSFLSRTTATDDDLHLRNNERSISEGPMITSADESTGIAMRVGRSSNFQPSLSSWGLNQVRTPVQQQPSGAAPWSFFPNTSSVAGRLSANLPAMSSGPSSSSHDATGSNGGSSQTHSTFSWRSLIMDVQDDDEDAYMPDYLRNLQSDDARTQLLSEIRQVLDALHQGERLAIEEFVVFEPFVHHGFAELHDRHRDMRLDVDNMSYEELLALEERIGDVSTGLSEETILKCMKQKKILGTDIAESMQEPCCICQEEYVDRDDLGVLDCEHEFHSECIKQWLSQKNICPVCKTTGLVA